MGSTPDGRAGRPAARHALGMALAFALWFAAGVGLGELADADRKVDPADLDHRVAARVVGLRGDRPLLTGFFRAVTQIGNLDVGLVLVLASVALLIHLRRRGADGIGPHDWIFWPGVVLASRLLSLVLKAWFRRERPPLDFRLIVEDSYSFPSGHSVSIAAAFAAGAVILARLLKPYPPWRNLLVGLCPVLIVLVAASRIWLGVHYLSDVVGGVVLGAGWALSACAIHFGWFDREPRCRRDSGAKPTADL